MRWNTGPHMMEKVLIRFSTSFDMMMAFYECWKLCSFNFVVKELQYDPKHTCEVLEHQLKNCNWDGNAETLKVDAIFICLSFISKIQTVMYMQRSQTNSCTFHDWWILEEASTAAVQKLHGSKCKGKKILNIIFVIVTLCAITSMKLHDLYYGACVLHSSM